MNMSGLSFNALPPIDLPFRFFLTAPLFVIACSLYVVFYGDSLWLSRWTPGMLTLTHAFTLGFITMVMMGALLQLLPVIGGIGLKYPRFVASTCHLLHCIGTVCLLFAFNFPHKWWFSLAILFLSISFFIYIYALIDVLIKKLSQGDSIVGFRLATTCLTVVIVLGLVLISRNLDLASIGLGQVLSADKHFTNIHAVWGIAGWGSLLIIAVSFQVIPMFHVAPNFPVLIRKYLSWLVTLLLIIYLYSPNWSMPLLFIAHAIFAICLLWVLSQRKRRIADTTIRYWQFAAIALLLSNILYFFPEAWLVNDSHTDSIVQRILQQKELILAAVIVYGYLVSVIQGMLIKILPFLSYTHLQQRCLMDFSAMQFIPNMHDFFTKKQALILFVLHVVTSILLLVVIIENQHFRIFSIALMLEFSWLFFLLSKTVLLYIQVNKKITLSSQS